MLPLMLNMELPNPGNLQKSEYGYDDDACEKAYRAIQVFSKTHGCNPDFLIIGSKIYLGIYRYYWEQGTIDQMSDVDSFDNVPLVLDPSAPKDLVSAVFAKPSDTLKRQVAPDRFVNPN